MTLKDEFKAAGVEMPKVMFCVKLRSQYIGHVLVEVYTNVGRFVETVEKQKAISTAKDRVLRRYLKQRIEQGRIKGE